MIIVIYCHERWKTMLCRCSVCSLNLPEVTDCSQPRRGGDQGKSGNCVSSKPFPELFQIGHPKGFVLALSWPFLFCVNQQCLPWLALPVEQKRKECVKVDDSNVCQYYSELELVCVPHIFQQGKRSDLIQKCEIVHLVRMQADIVSYLAGTDLVCHLVDN